MRILYLPCHHRLRAEEISLFREMGHEVIVGVENADKDFDICIAVHKPVLFPYIKTFLKQKKKVYYRTIGQSTPGLEADIGELRGVRVVRMSPNEAFLPAYAGHDYVIPFFKDKNIWKGWNGDENHVIGFG